ncbi:putative small auxin-up RNA [Helianthus annuus]|uniref:Small auxin-up RNA n=1 Tax=Helianthus annuus TaxID=4232 RepID=A0A251UX16_HELAN|nr:putative small auxin-up RNA [Helianthus annuus]KAJ0581027.1 putative small auxin-up RNA [Helianthus annuus]KAJ0588807.1 putative small auxin-up RNA [Helianthus annuus]KAJ0596970.1 putative small auxin-up RNA [Helianthus annuus]KAJ0757652.1 putative small auxin-up RNA [Helianthus annuus]
MGVGEHFLIFHHQHDHGMKKEDHKMKIPKGCMTVMVGQEDEEQKRFIIPVTYVNHPLFMELLNKETDQDEYEFHHQGPINIHCHVQDFCNIQGMIHQDHHNHHHHHHHHHRHICCL